MLAHHQIEELITTLASWDRHTLTSKFLNFRSSFPVDFNSDFLRELSEERMRHIFFALCVQNQTMPDGVKMTNSPAVPDTVKAITARNRDAA